METLNSNIPIKTFPWSWSWSDQTYWTFCTVMFTVYCSCSYSNLDFVFPPLRQTVTAQLSWHQGAWGVSPFSSSVSRSSGPGLICLSLWRPTPGWWGAPSRSGGVRTGQGHITASGGFPTPSLLWVTWSGVTLSLWAPGMERWGKYNVSNSWSWHLSDCYSIFCADKYKDNYVMAILNYDAYVVKIGSILCYIW